MPGPRIAIFIPAYNCAKTLPGVLDRIPQQVREAAEEIFVVDDASADGTDQVARDYKARQGLESLQVYRNERNLGYGGSQKFAYRHAIEQGYDIVVMLHGDAQYAPEYLEVLLEPIRQGEADLMFGSRMSGSPLAGGMPLHKFIGNKFLTGLENLVLGWNLSEFHSGFRAFRCEALRQVPFQACSDYYHFDSEILIQFKLRGLRVVEQPIPTHYGAERCYLNVWRYGVSILGTLGAYLLHRTGMRRTATFELLPAELAAPEAEALASR